MENITNYRTFNYGVWTGFQKMFSFSFMYTTDHIFSVLPIKHLVNQEGETTTNTNFQWAQNLKYQTNVIHYVHVLYKRQLHMLTQRC